MWLPITAPEGCALDVSASCREPPARRRARGEPGTPRRGFDRSRGGTSASGREVRCYRSTRRPELPQRSRASRVPRSDRSRSGFRAALTRRHTRRDSRASCFRRNHGRRDRATRLRVLVSPRAFGDAAGCVSDARKKKKNHPARAPRGASAGAPRASPCRRACSPEHDQDASAGARARGEPENPAPNPVPRALRRLLRRHPGVRARRACHGDARAPKSAGVVPPVSRRPPWRAGCSRRARGRHQAAPASRRVENASRRAANRRERQIAHPLALRRVPPVPRARLALRHRAGDDVRGAEAVARLRGRSSINAARAGDAGRRRGRVHRDGHDAAGRARTAEVCAAAAGVECRGASCLAALVQRGGPGVLRGAAPRMLEISLGGAIYFSALEAAKRALGWDESESQERSHHR